MLTPDEVSAMVRLHELGWGLKRIAGELGCSRNTVKRYIEADGWVGYRKPRRRRRLAHLESWLARGRVGTISIASPRARSRRPDGGADDA
jgi:hypothetical protein